jgi:chromosome segregation ATPase
MELETFALFVALEMALLFACALFLLHRKYVNLRKQVDEQPSPVITPDNFDSIESGYFSYLEKELLATRARLEQIQGEADVNAVHVQTLQTRLSLLEAEKQVVESTNDYPDRHWEFVLERFKPIDEELEEELLGADIVQEEPSVAAQSEPDITGFDDGSDSQIETLQDNLHQQGIALDSMRQVLQQVKQDPQAGLIEQLEQQLKELEHRYREADTCIEIMGQENDRLQEKIERRDYRIDQVESEKTESVADLEEQLDKQKRSISDLHGLVGDLQLETEKAKQLQDKLDQFALASRDMNMCIQVLEEENQFLQEQIAQLLKADEDVSVYDKREGGKAPAELEAQIEALRTELNEKEQKVREAEEKYNAMEQEYLTLYEEANA